MDDPIPANQSRFCNLLNEVDRESSVAGKWSSVETFLGDLVDIPPDAVKVKWVDRTGRLANVSGEAFKHTPRIAVFLLGKDSLVQAAVKKVRKSIREGRVG